MSRTYDDHRTHATQRARERYGVTLSSYDYWRLCEQIRQRDPRRARHLTQLAGTRDAWLVLYGARWMVALVEASTGAIVTFLALGTQFVDGRQASPEWAQAPVHEGEQEAAS